MRNNIKRIIVENANTGIKTLEMVMLGVLYAELARIIVAAATVSGIGVSSK